MDKRWILYGVNGYTGVLLAEEAIKKKLHPIIAGRSKEKVAPIAGRLDLDHLIFDLHDDAKLIEIFKDCDLILNAAGPFMHTSRNIVKACLKTRTHYLDITGEIPIFEENFTLNQQAIDSEIAIISGVGFDVVPTDCIARYTSKKIDDPTQLEIGVAGLTTFSRGTLKTVVESLPSGILMRREGKLEKRDGGPFRDKIRFYDKERPVVPVSWGDLATSYRTTRIPNITVYMPPSKELAHILKTPKNDGGNHHKGSGQENLVRWIERNVYGPDEEARLKGAAHVWASVSNKAGDQAETWLETIEPYRFTYMSGIKAVERVLKSELKGTLTPSLAFGEDFILEFPDTTRHDSLI